VDFRLVLNKVFFR